MIYHRNSRSSHYSYTELFLHVSEVKKNFQLLLAALNTVKQH